MKTLAVAAIRCSLIFLLPTVAYSISAQWDLDPISGDWNTAANWTPMGVPNGPADVATFDLSSTTGVSISANTEVNEIIFTSAATNPYTITAIPGLTLTISGIGITNNSGITQSFVTASNGAGAAGSIAFTGVATAGSMTSFTNNGPTTGTGRGGSTEFYNSSSAGSGTFTNKGSTVSSAFSGGTTEFHDTSSAGSGTFTNSGATVSGGSGGLTSFFNSSSAGSGTFTNNGAVAGISGGETQFHDTSSAGSGTFTNNGAMANNGFVGVTRFFNSSSAGGGTFTNNGATLSGRAGGLTAFFDSSSAGSGTFTNNGGTVIGAFSGDTEFFGSSSAGSSTFINNGATVSGGGSGLMQFMDTSSAGNATLIANGGLGRGGEIIFQHSSSGGTARVEVFNNGYLDISGHDAPGVTIGSIEGDGAGFLGANNLTVGSNNLSTTFSGVIQDGGGFKSTGGSITKTGSGTLTLSGANTYTGSTIVDAGQLVVNGSITSAVTVNGGAFRGSGMTRSIAVSNGGTLAPGDGPGILTVQGNLILAMGANYLVDLNGTVVGTQYSQTSVSGMVNLGNATLALNLGFTPPIGAIFVIIYNTANDPVAGIFDGLPEGTIFTQGGQAFTISYHGGDGNDVVVTSVIPEPNSWTLFVAGAVTLSVCKSQRRRV